MGNEMQVNLSNDSVLSKTLIIISVALISLGVFTSVYMNFVDRSLWHDEAALAELFCRRSFSELGSRPFENLQSAPLGWLYFEKTLTVLWGQTGFVLRIGSILGFCLTVLFACFVVNQLSSNHFGLATSAFVANMHFLLVYSNMFKPYIWDCFCILLVILAFSLYKRKKMSVFTLTVIWMAVFWFSLPSCFFEAGLFLVELISMIIHREERKEKGWKLLKDPVIIVVGITLSFSIHYFHWMRGNVSGMQTIWASKAFPLIPTSHGEFMKMRTMFMDLFSKFFIKTGTRWVQTFVMIMYFASLVVGIIKKNKIVIGVHLSVFLGLFASYLHFYPMVDRLWCFFNPIAAILVGYALDGLLGFVIKNRKAVQLAVWLILSLGFFTNNAIQFLVNKDMIYWSGEEMDSNIAYIDNNIMHDELVYVNPGNAAAFQFKNGYDDTSIGGYYDNVIFGESRIDGLIFVELDEIEFDAVLFGGFAEKVSGKRGVYVPLSHYDRKQYLKFRDCMYLKGRGEVVSLEHNTPLFYYYKDINASKMAVYMERICLNNEDNTQTVRLHNEGKAFVNHRFEQSFFVNSLGSRYQLTGELAPGDYMDVVVAREEADSVSWWIENEYGVECSVTVAD